jgi:hypothetical protein
MARQPKNHNKRWTTSDERALKQLAAGNTPTGLIAWKLGRTEDAVYGHASEIGVSLKPTNKPPYNRRKRGG